MGRAMAGKHEAQKEKRPRKSVFANAVIVVCVVVALLITAAVIWEYHRLETVMPAGVLTALFAFWGGELMIIALRQIFGSDAVAKAKAAAENGSGNTNTYY